MMAEYGIPDEDECWDYLYVRMEDRMSACSMLNFPDGDCVMTATVDTKDYEGTCDDMTKTLNGLIDWKATAHLVEEDA